jgi:hypothetical protein
VWAAIEPAQAAALLHDAWRRELVQIRQRSSDILRFFAGEVVDEFGSAGVVIALVVVDGLLGKPSAGNEVGRGVPKGRSWERPRFQGLPE